jgi:translation elongation factor EF-G
MLKKKYEGLHQQNYVRIYKGLLSANKSTTTVINSTRRIKQPPNIKIYSPIGDILEPVQEVSEGNIAIVTGLENTKTGDTLIGFSKYIYIVQKFLF